MNIYDYLSYTNAINDVINSDNIRIGDVCDEFNMTLIISDFYRGNKSLFVVLPNLYQAQKYYDTLSNYIDEKDVLFFPADELLSAEIIAATGDFLFERINTITTLLEGGKKIIVTNMNGAIKYEMSPKKWKDNIFSISQYDTYDIYQLCRKLISMGYESVFTIQKTGQFSKRGSIVDIFPLGYDKPVRIDFFGDEIDSIKYFAVDTQRSIEKVNSISIVPVTELIYNDDEFVLAKEKILSFLDDYSLSQIEEEMYSKNLFDLENHKNLESMARYLTFFDDSKCTIFDFVENKRIYFIDPVKTKDMFNSIVLDLNEYSSRLGGYSVCNMDLFKNLDLLIFKANVLIEALRSFDYVDKNIGAKSINPYLANKKNIVKELTSYSTRTRLILAFRNEENYKKIYELFEDERIFIKRLHSVNDISGVGIYGFVGEVPTFSLESEGVVVINDRTLLDSNYQPKKAKYKSIFKNAVKISKYDELVLGDYVVHYDHGIGVYKGIKTIKTEDIVKDCLYVEYANNTALYIPLEQISNIMKYASGDVEGIKINEIGSTSWTKTKAKVRKKVHDISEKLISIYAARLSAKGYEFPEDDELQELFESDFEYDLTVDQQKCVDAIKRDMQSPRPMDRLVCGDVGYGKTEVAMRAAFKAVLGGKQVCMLAPTTILSRQHYHTFKKRMEKYGVKVELLSRFVSKSKQEEVIDGIKSGSVDVVVGTHRVLSNEITFKALGLLIVDEEQRFGVTHKEKIKELKVEVDCITLTATPIPRTLQMSVMGIKDLSMIETPPKNRYPIQTYVLERNDRIVADAIMREMARGGQVFYLYNRVDSIEEVKDKLHTLVPDAKIGIGHGKLSKDQLENVITKFIDKEYDILLCTTIIETGIDMPDTNTLIIHDADRLGLAQMYQIRGRVGRSNKIAYAYLMYEPRKMLTPQAEKRLETIKEFNELGSGYKIAMRDLSIRGGGDILGEEQSGFIETVGLDMYLKILDEEINKKPKVEIEKPDRSLTTPLASRTIKDTYVNNDDARIYIHKRIDKINSLEALNDLTNELVDRFGEVDNELKLYMHEKLMKAYCKELNIYKIDTSNRRYMSFVFTKEHSKILDGNKLFDLLRGFKFVTLTYKEQEIRILLEIQGREKLDYFVEINNYFNKVIENNYCQLDKIK